MLSNMEKEQTKKKKQVQAVRPRLRLSPNELDRLYKEEVDRRRKLRLVQVRQIAKENARDIRTAVKATRKKELGKLALEVQVEWEKDRALKLQQLEDLYQKNLDSVGDAHQAAALQYDHEDEKLAQQEEDLRRADERYHAAMQKLVIDREQEYEEANRAIIARQLALKVEQERAAKIAKLPPPPPNPIVGIEAPKVKPIQFTDASAFSATHYHIPDMCAVVKATDEEQIDAKAAAELEQCRYDQTMKEGKRERHEQHEKARLRHMAALNKELLKQDYDQILLDLSDLQRDAVHKRQQQVATIPKQIFAPPHRRLEERVEQQGNMERAFEDLYLKATDYVGDISLALDPHPPPEMPAASDDLDLSHAPDVSELEPTKLPADHPVPRTAAFQGQKMGPPVQISAPPPLRDVTNVTKELSNNRFNPRDTQLRKLLNRVKSHRDAWMNQNKEKEEQGPNKLSKDVERPCMAPSDASSSETLTQYTLRSDEDPHHDGTSLEEGTITSSASSDARLVKRALANLDSRNIPEGPTHQPPKDDGTLLHPMEQANRVRNKPAEQPDMEIFLGTDEQQKEYLQQQQENERKKKDVGQRQTNLQAQKEELKRQIADIEKKRQLLLRQQQQQQQQRHLQHHQIITNFQNNLSPPHEMPAGHLNASHQPSDALVDGNLPHPSFVAPMPQPSSLFDPNTPFHHPDGMNVTLDRVRAYQAHLLNRNRDQPVEQSRADLERRTQELLDSYNSWKNGNSLHSSSSPKQTNLASRSMGLEPFEDVEIPSTYAGSKSSPNRSVHFESDRTNITLPSCPDSSISQPGADSSIGHHHGAPRQRYLYQVIQHSDDPSRSLVSMPMSDPTIQQHTLSSQYPSSGDPSIHWASNLSKMAADDERDFDAFNEQKKIEFEHRQSDLRRQLEEIRRQKHEILERQKRHQDEMNELKEKWSLELRSYRDSDEVLSRYVADPSSVETTTWSPEGSSIQQSPSSRTRGEFVDELSNAEHHLSGIEQTHDELMELEQLEAEWEARQALERELQMQRASFVPHELSTIQEMDTPLSERVPSRPSTQRRQYSTSPIREEDASHDAVHSPSATGTSAARALNFQDPPPDGPYQLLTGKIIIHAESPKHHESPHHDAPMSASDVLDEVLERHKGQIGNMAQFKAGSTSHTDPVNNSFEPLSEGIVIGSTLPHGNTSVTNKSPAGAQPNMQQNSINVSAGNISSKPSWHEILSGLSTSSADSSLRSERKGAVASSGIKGVGQLHHYTTQNTSSPIKDGPIAWSDLTSGGILDMQFQSPIELQGNAGSYHRLSSTPCKPTISEVPDGAAFPQHTLSTSVTPTSHHETPTGGGQHSIVSQYPLPSSAGTADINISDQHRTMLSQYTLDTSQSTSSPDSLPPHSMHITNPSVVMKERIGNFSSELNSVNTWPVSMPLNTASRDKLAASAPNQEIDALVAKYMPRATGIEASAHTSQLSEGTDSSWQAGNVSSNFPPGSISHHPPPSQQYAHLISSLPSPMKMKISQARQLIDSDATQSESDDPIRASSAVTRKVEQAVAQYERLLDGQESPEQVPLPADHSPIDGAVGGVLLDTSMTGLQASVNQLTLLVNDHAQRRHQEAAARERAQQLEEAQQRTARSQQGALEAIAQQQQEFQAVLAHRRHIHENSPPGKMHLPSNGVTPKMSPKRQLDLLSREGAGITDELDLTLVSLASDLGEVSISKSPHEKGQTSLLSFEEHEASATTDPSATPKAYSPSSMLKSVSHAGYPGHDRSKVTKGVTWAVDNEGNLMQRAGFDSSHDDRSGLWDSETSGVYHGHSYSADLETSDDRVPNYSTDDLGSAHDGDGTNEGAGLSLAEAFMRRRADFISGTNQRHQEARGKVKKKMSGHGALSKTLASWKKSHTGRKPQAHGSGGAGVGPIDRSRSMKTTAAGEKKKFETEMKQRTNRLYNLTEEAKVRKLEEDRKKQYALNREKAKLYQKKHHDQVKKKQDKTKK